jgi:hypothetical protein
MQIQTKQTKPSAEGEMSWYNLSICAISSEMEFSAKKKRSMGI